MVKQIIENDMLSNISWFQFFLAAAAILAVYYLMLFSPWKQVVKQPRTAPVNTEEDPDGLQEDERFVEEMPDEADLELSAAEELAAKLREIILQTGLGNFVRAELLAGLQKEIAMYPSLNKEEYKAAFNDLIQEEVQKKCAVMLSVSELDGLWG